MHSMELLHNLSNTVSFMKSMKGIHLLELLKYLGGGKSWLYSLLAKDPLKG